MRQVITKFSMRSGKREWEAEPLHVARDRARMNLASLHAGIKRLINPHRYPVGLEASLHARRAKLVLAARGASW